MYVYLSISLYLYNYDYPGAQEASLREPSFAYISGCLGKVMLFVFLGRHNVSSSKWQSTVHNTDNRSQKYLEAVYCETTQCFLSTQLLDQSFTIIILRRKRRCSFGALISTITIKLLFISYISPTGRKGGRAGQAPPLSRLPPNCILIHQRPST